ncbi:MAG TPA: SPOR domain-containing protein, partial [Croceibacterium sp.]
LVRIERRGPMTGTELVALSPGALTQLGVVQDSPVRVRRVNPPEEQRALLRAGQPAPLRMDTPMPLVEVLRRKLPGARPVPLRDVAATPAPQPELAAAPALPAQHQPAPVVPQRPTAPAQTGASPPPLPPIDSGAEVAVARTPPPAAVRETVDGGFVVQAAAFSTADRAARAANVVGGEVSRSGAFYRVRTGPFATRGEAEASLAKVRAAGYSDARIFTNG